MLHSNLIFPGYYPIPLLKFSTFTYSLPHTLHIGPVCLCWKVTIFPYSVAILCHSLACFMTSQGPPMWTASAYLASSPSRWIQPKEGTCRSLAGRKTKMVAYVFPTSFLPAWPHIFSRCSLSYDFSCWMLPQTTSAHSRNSSVLPPTGSEVWQRPTAASYCWLLGPCCTALFPSCCTPLWRVPSLRSHWNSS